MFTGSSSFWILLSGQFLSSMTYLIETNACSMLSAVWFPPNERTIATTTFAIVSAEVRGHHPSLVMLVFSSDSLFYCIINSGWEEVWCIRQHFCPNSGNTVSAGIGIH